MSTAKVIVLTAIMSCFMVTVLWAKDAKIPETRNNCYHTPWFSEEGDAKQECDTAQGYAVRGINCKGAYCDDKQLYCCADGLPQLNPSNRIETPYFSDEDGAHIDKSRVMTALACTGRYCDNISMTMYGFQDGPNIVEDWTQPAFSEEQGSDRCSRNGVEVGFVVGLNCSGSYCDKLSLTCARYSENN